jgi:enterochelin esterase-like enzyme
MSDSKREKFQSHALDDFTAAYIKASTKVEKDLLWNSMTTPLIEKISGDENNCLVTFLYRVSPSEFDKGFLIYLDSGIIGLPFSKISQLQNIPNTDLYYLTLKLPSTLRTAYTFLKLDKSTESAPKNEMTHTFYPYPKFVGKMKESHDTLMRLHAEKKFDTDPRNPKRISYVEYDNPDNCFFTESILELPNAPAQEAYLSDVQLIKKERNHLAEEKRFFEQMVSFSKTSLKNLEEYTDNPEDKDQPPKSQRKYWIYLPPNYNNKAEGTYPLLVFLDGSDYLNTVPIPSILERMINNKEIPPSIAIFFEYSTHRRQLEYYGDDRFTEFLANDLIDILRKEHHLRITTDPKTTTIIGFSASGLAAIHAGLTRPDVFGNVITQSAALWPKKKKDLQKLVDEHTLKKTVTVFCMEAGSFETTPIECQFQDGTTQAVSINQANKDLNKYMQEKNIVSTFHEFVGGHNYVCYRGSIADRLKEVFKIHYNKHTDFNSGLRSKL